MKEVLFILAVSAVSGYLIGCINPAFFLARIRGYDIREHGSGNAGASNVIITMGKGIGLLVAFVDVFKAFLAVELAMLAFPDDSLLAGFCSATFVILGNIFPFYMGFKGGKGFASLGGSVLAIDVNLCGPADHCHRYRICVRLYMLCANIRIAGFSGLVRSDLQDIYSVCFYSGLPGHYIQTS